MSAIRHAVCSSSPEFRNSSADANARVEKPASFIKPFSECRINSSSSTIATNFGASSVAMFPQKFSDDQELLINCDSKSVKPPLSVLFQTRQQVRLCCAGDIPF